MNRILQTIALIFVVSIGWAQPPEPSVNCETAPILCNLDDLTGYEATMVTDISPPPQPAPLCPNTNTGAHNIVWFGFVAGSDFVQIDIGVSNCQPGNNGILGVQAGIYTDCSFSEDVDCQGAGQTGPFTLQGPVIPGQTYYVFLDGNGGSWCDIVIDVVQGGEPYTIPDPDGPLEFIFSEEDFLDCPGPCTEVCLGGEISFEVPVVAEGQVLDYIWTIDPPSSDYPTGEIDLTTYTGNLEFNEEGTFTICAQAVTGCDDGEQACITVEVKKKEDEVLDPYEVCANDLEEGVVPPEWEGSTIYSAGVYAEDLESNPYGCIFSQTVEVIELELPEPEYIELLICENSYNVCSDVFLTDQFETEVLCEDGAANGCDSTVIATISFAKAIGFLADPICKNGKFIFVWNGAVFPTDAESIEYTLYNDGVVVATGSGNPNLVEIEVDIQEGVFWLEIVVSKFGTSCTFESGTVNVSDNGLIPAMPEIDPWSLNPCVLDVVTYQLAPGADPNSTYNWTILPDDPSLVVTNNGTSITIDWTTASFTTYTICVTEDNGCALSPPNCQEINILSAPVADMELADTICVNSSVLISYTGTTLGAGTYNWNFDGGTPDNANTNLPGPFNVTYTSTGLKYITLNVAEGSCASENVVDSVLVVPPLEAPVVNCSSTITSITFNWSDVAGSEGVDVEILDAPSTATVVTNPNDVTCTDLNAGESITIIVTTIDPGYCANTKDTITCTAFDCDPINITVEAINDICLAAGAASVNINASSDDGGAGTFTYSGNGIADENVNVFDPNLAGPGVHQIVVTYEIDGCTYPQPITINVFDVPVNSFTVEDSICVLNTATVNYTGTFASGNFTWDFDGGTIVNGDNAGPYTIRWDTPGMKTISSTTEANGCTSEQTTFVIDVQPSIDTPNLTCESSTNDITFNWNNVDNVSGYEVFINGESKGVQTTNTYFVDQLVPGNNVQIEVVAMSNNLCPNASATLECQASLCPDAFVKLTADTSICLVANSATVQIVLEQGGTDPSGTITWSGTGVDQNGVFDPKIAGVGIHPITVTYNHLNCTETDVIEMNVKPTPVANMQSLDVICVTDSLDISLNLPDPSNTIVTWQNAGANIIAVSNDSYKAVFPNGGTYKIGVIFELDGCTSEVFEKEIKVEEPLKEPTFSCDPSTNEITFSWTDVDCASDYIVFINNVQQGTQKNTSFKVENLSEGEKVDLRIIAVSECACENEEFTFSCTAVDCPTVNITIDPVGPFCYEKGISAAPLNVNVSGIDNTWTEEWIGSFINGNNFDVESAGVGQHTVIRRVTKDNCSFEESILIDVFDTPTLSLDGTDPACNGGSDGVLKFEPNGGDGNYSYKINDLAVDQFDLNNMPPGSYTVVVTDGNNCGTSAQTTLINPADQSVKIQGSEVIIYGNSETLSLKYNLSDDKLTKIVWKDSSGNVLCQGGIDCKDIEIKPELGNQYCVEITYNGKCLMNDCIDIRVQKIKKIYIPNIFSPNSDNLNDIFVINANDEIQSIPFVRIFNRWGEKVFEKENISKNNGVKWDGKFKGNTLNPGVYVYSISVVYVDGTSEVIHGDITIIK